MTILDWYNEADLYKLAEIEASQCLMSESMAEILTSDTRHISKKREIHHRVLTEHFVDILSGDYDIFAGYCKMYNFIATRSE
jgi:hypothetical protein